MHQGNHKGLPLQTFDDGRGKSFMVALNDYFLRVA
ncbi:hypothetical protein BGP_6374 [Beggiatoa sp. PS]|nr:hypothetical protein BGP_6374 [Beggiatoa sp. PS]